jgi:group I intron endonuclease
MEGEIMFTLYLITNIKCPQRTQYIGQTVQTLTQRWASHKREARLGSQCHIHRAIRKYGTEAFTIEVIHTVAQDADSLNEWERFYIEALRQAGRLYNMTDGGEGVSGRTPSAKARAAASATMKRLNADPVWAAEHAERMRKQHADPVFAAENAARSAELMRKQNSDPDFQKKMVAGIVKKHADPVYAAEHAERTRKRHLDPEFRKKLARGSRCHSAKLTESDIPTIKRMREAGSTCQEIGDKYSVSRRAVWCIVQGKSWKHVQ